MKSMDVIRTLPSDSSRLRFRSKKEKQTCPIYRATITEEDNMADCPECGQTFHYNHFAEWVKTKGKCPLCKEELFTESMEQDQQIVSPEDSKIGRHQGVPLIQREVKVLQELENFIEGPLTAFDSIFPVFGFMVEQNHVVILDLPEKGLTKLPRIIGQLINLRKLRI